MPIANILVVEDVAPTRAWLEAVAKQAYPDAAVASVGTLRAARSWLDGYRGELNPLALVDIGLPDGSGIEFVRELLAALPAAQPVVTTLFDDDDNLLAAMAAGAKGYLLKDHEPSDMVRRLHAMDRGDSPISPSIAARILAHFRAHARFVGRASEEVGLTPRETDVLRLIAKGLKVSETGKALAISEATVAGYLKTIYRKLDISSRAEAALEAARRGLI